MEMRNGRSLRGFASMSKERQREIASRGGRVAHEKGAAHEFNSVEAALAARKGHERGTAHEFTTEEAREAGRKGGLARARKHMPPDQLREEPVTVPSAPDEPADSPTPGWRNGDAD
jgi:general stress protein YciG